MKPRLFIEPGLRHIRPLDRELKLGLDKIRGPWYNERGDREWQTTAQA